MADTYYIRSWKNYQWTVQYMLNEWLPEDPIEDHVTYGNVGEWDDQGCWTRRPGHYVYICYSPDPWSGLKPPSVGNKGL